MAYSSVSHLIDVAQASPFLRTGANDMMMSYALAKMLSTLGLTLVTPVYSNDTYGISFQIAFEAVRLQYAIQTVCSNLVPFGVSADDMDSNDDNSPIKEMADCIANSISSVVILFSKTFFWGSFDSVCRSFSFLQ